MLVKLKIIINQVTQDNYKKSRRNIFSFTSKLLSVLQYFKTGPVTCSSNVLKRGHANSISSNLSITLFHR